MNIRWIVGAAAWAAYSLAAWFVGDALPMLEGPFERFALIVVGVAGSGNWRAHALAQAKPERRDRRGGSGFSARRLSCRCCCA
jgi:hypothetical protein